jgi:phosphatidylethanolamine N-methyltransferase
MYMAKIAPTARKSDPFATTYRQVVTIVALSVDLDPKLIPRSAGKLAERLALGDPYEDSLEDDSDPQIRPDLKSSRSGTGASATSISLIGDEADDFAIMDEHQAKRIKSTIKMSFDVDLSVEMILANTNVSAITKRIRDSRRLVEEKGTNTASG